MAAPALSSTSTTPSRASPRSATAAPASTLRSRSRRTAVGQADHPAVAFAKESPKSPSGGWISSVSPSASMFGPWPESSTPSTVQVSPSVVPISTVPQATSTRTDGVRFEGAAAWLERRAAATWTADARWQVADPAEAAGQDPRREEAERPRNDQPTEHLERRPREDEPETDADQDQRPERPPSIEHGRVERARSGPPAARRRRRRRRRPSPRGPGGYAPRHDTSWTGHMATRRLPGAIRATALC